jgi:hypothetical protein
MISGWVTHVLDQVSAVGEVQLRTDRRSVVGLDVLGQRVGEVVPVLGVQRTQIPVLDLFDRFDVGDVRGVIVGAHHVIAAHG